jgi:hypothetical protein
MDLQKEPTKEEQIAIVDKMLGMIAAGKTTGMDDQEKYTMKNALQLYRGYVANVEVQIQPVIIRTDESTKRDPKRKGTRKVRS